MIMRGKTTESLLLSVWILHVLLLAIATAQETRPQEAAGDERKLPKRQGVPPGRFFAAAPLAGPGCIPAPSACACPPGMPVYSPAAGPVPVPIASAPMMIPPIASPLPPPPAGRLIPQALPGAPCEPGVECTGGSVCSRGICLCPPELVQEGTVCVSRTIYGVVPPAPPPIPVAPSAPIVAAYPPSMPAPSPIVSMNPCLPPAFAPPAAPCTYGPPASPFPYARRNTARKRHVFAAASSLLQEK